MQIDLNAASNMFGALGEDVRARLMAAVEQPGEATWDDAHSIVLNPDVGFGLTLWQAVIAVDPEFARVGGPVSDGHGNRVSGWARTPTAEVLAQAINYATR
jgi:hypothetical protein